MQFLILATLPCILALPTTILQSRQACSGDGVSACNDADQTWSRCDGFGNSIPMGTFDPQAWSCASLTAAFTPASAAASTEKRSVLGSRQSCEGAGVSACNDADQTWSRCDGFGNSVPMGTFDPQAWSCASLTAAFAG